MLNRAIVLLLLAVVAVALLAYSRFQTEPLKVSGLIEAYEIRIGSRVGGRVQNVFVEEGATVNKGAMLVELEPFDLMDRRGQAAAELAAQVAEYEKLMKGFRPEEIAQAKAKYDQLAAQFDELQHGPRKQEIAAAEARVRLAEAQLELAQEQLARIERLIGQNAATPEERDQAVTELRVARETHEVRQEELALLREGTRLEVLQQSKAQLEEARQAWLLRQNGYREEEIAQAEATAEATRAALRAVEQQIAELKIVAPVDAVVEAIDLRPGDLVSANAPILSLIDTSRLWVRAYVPENQLHLHIDQVVSVSVDSYPDERFQGHISFVARQAEFTPSNVQTPDERSKQVFRIRVTLDEGLDRLRPGMSADVWLDGDGEI